MRRGGFRNVSGSRINLWRAIQDISVLNSKIDRCILDRFAPFRGYIYTNCMLFKSHSFSHCYARASKENHDVTTSIHIFNYTHTVPRIHKYYPERIKSPAENTCDTAES